MSRIKEFYHEEICREIEESQDEFVDEEYFYQKEKDERSRTCDGYKTSNCCGASLVHTDICCDCGDHAEPSCVDCDLHCDNYVEELVS